MNQVPIDRVYTIETQNGVPTFIATNYYGSTSFVVMQYTIQFLFLEKQLFIATVITLKNFHYSIFFFKK